MSFYMDEFDIHNSTTLFVIFFILYSAFFFSFPRANTPVLDTYVIMVNCKFFYTFFYSQIPPSRSNSFPAPWCRWPDNFPDIYGAASWGLPGLWQGPWHLLSNHYIPFNPQKLVEPVRFQAEPLSFLLQAGRHGPFRADKSSGTAVYLPQCLWIFIYFLRSSKP